MLFRSANLPNKRSPRLKSSSWGSLADCAARRAHSDLVMFSGSPATGPSHQHSLWSLSTLHSAFSLTKSTPHANSIIPAPLITSPPQQPGYHHRPHTLDLGLTVLEVTLRTAAPPAKEPGSYCLIALPWHSAHTRHSWAPPTLFPTPTSDHRDLEASPRLLCRHGREGQWSITQPLKRIHLNQF